jgi:hypothetical protein
VAAGAVVGTDNGNGAIAGAGIAGSISSYTGPGEPITISVTFAVDPAADVPVVVTYSQGCAQIDAQMALQGSYMRDATPGNVSTAS